MSKSNKKQPPAGQVRQSQILSTFGLGSMVDLPEHFVIIAGLSQWRGDKKRIYEERLQARVAEILEVKEITLYAPPVDEQDPKATRTGINALTFPTWFLRHQLTHIEILPSFLLMPDSHENLEG